MNEYTREKLKIVAGALFFGLCLALVIIGQRTVGWGSLALMLLGLCGILALLYAYNRRFEKPVRASRKKHKKEHKDGA